MDFPTDSVTWTGPPLDDLALEAELPSDLCALLSQHNGFVLHGGALHVRGLVSAPPWHSLRQAWRGAEALSSLFPRVLPTDVPFAQDCVGDQFLLRDGQVLRLEAETGEVYPVAASLEAFVQAAAREALASLQAHVLEQFRAAGSELAPGHCLHADPPLCTIEAEEGVLLRAIPAEEVLRLHAELARQLAEVPDVRR